MRLMVLTLCVIAAIPSLTADQAKDQPARQAEPDDIESPDNVPADRPSPMVEALRPLVPKLPNPTSFKLGEVTAARADLGLLFFGMPPAQRQKLDKSVQEVAGFAGADSEPTDEAIDFCVITFDDPAVAGQYPAWKAQSFRDNVPFIQAAGVTIDKVSTEQPKLPGTDKQAVLVRVTGKVKRTGKPYTNTHVRVAEGSRVIEVALRNLTMGEKELLDLLAETTKRVRAVDASPGETDKKGK